jgi:hypothetical protein
MSGKDVQREVNELAERYVVHRLIPVNKERARTEYLVKLTHLALTDGLKSKRASGRGLARGQNWLLKPLRLWEELCYQSTRGQRTGRAYLFGPVTRIDADTALLVVFGHEHPYRLVWRQGENFGYRKLSENDSAVLAVLDLDAVRELGFVDFSWPPDLEGFGDEPEPKRPTRRRRGS